MTAKVHTVETLGAELLEILPALKQPQYAETLMRVLAAQAEPEAGWRTAGLQTQVPTELRAKIKATARRKYKTVDTLPSDV